LGALWVLWGVRETLGEPGNGKEGRENKEGDVRG